MCNSELTVLELAVNVITVSLQGEATKIQSLHYINALVNVNTEALQEGFRVQLYSSGGKDGEAK